MKDLEKREREGGGREGEGMGVSEELWVSGRRGEEREGRWLKH